MNQLSNVSLPGNDCGHGLDFACSNVDCGSTCQNNSNTPNHHRNIYRNYNSAMNLNLLGSGDLQFTYVAFMNCANGDHSWLKANESSAWGLGGGDYAYLVYDYNGNDLDSAYVALVHLMYHEISHCFNCGHDGDPYNGGIWNCSENQFCCMSTGFRGIENTELRTIWCDNCATERFNRTLH